MHAVCDFGEFSEQPNGILASIRRHETRMALFKAALTAVKSGPDKLKDIEDPYSNGPFEFRSLAKGFTLKSKLLFKGQPVMLSVGQGRRDE